jgi:DNA-binding PadR family transcriptional regulator
VPVPGGDRGGMSPAGPAAALGWPCPWRDRARRSQSGRGSAHALNIRVLLTPLANRCRFRLSRRWLECRKRCWRSLAEEPVHGYELRQRLVQALGPVGDVINPGQGYVTLSRLERAGLVRGVQVVQSAVPDKKVYEATAVGRETVSHRLLDSSWPKAAATEFHLKLFAAAAIGLADPVAPIDTQRRELLRRARRVRQVNRAAPARRVGPAQRRGVVVGRAAGGPAIGDGVGAPAPAHDRFRLPGFPPGRRVDRGGATPSSLRRSLRACWRAPSASRPAWPSQRGP